MCASDHCTLLKYALVVKRMPNSLMSVLDNPVQVVNFIKASHLNFKLFKLLCNDMCIWYETLIFHMTVRWLSPGKVLMTVL
jgi:hypothetical protein